MGWGEPGSQRGRDTVNPWEQLFMTPGRLPGRPWCFVVLRLCSNGRENSTKRQLALPSSSCSRKGLVPALEAELLEWSEWLEALGDVLGLLVPELSEYRPDESRSSVS